MAILWVSLNVQTKPMLWSLQLYLLLLLQQCPHLLRFMPHLQAKKRLSKGSKCWDHMIIIWSTRLSSVYCIASVRGVSKWFMMCVCVCVKAKKCAPDLLPAFASCPRLKKMKTDSWPQYIICNSFVIQKSGQILAAPETLSRSNPSLDPAHLLKLVGCCEIFLLQSYRRGLPLLYLGWRDVTAGGKESSHLPLVVSEQKRQAEGKNKIKKGLWLVVNYEICDCICNTEVALLENLTRTVPHVFE